jgi:zinc metalloprotease ZmpB
MENQYRPELKAHVSVDAEGIVRHVLHSEDLWRPTEENPRRAAIEYVRAQAGLLEIADPALDRLDEPVTYTEPREEGESYRLAEEKRQFDSVTVAFAQTYLNVPVWRTGISVTVKAEPSSIVESTNTALAGVRAEMPSDEAIGRWRELCAVAEGRAGDVGEEAPAATPSDRMLRDALGLTEERAGETDAMAAVVRDADRLRVNQGRFFVYRYDPEERQPKAPDVDDDNVLDLEREDVELTFPLPPVPPTIQPGRDYLVAEVVFTLPFAGFDKLNWRALIEVETNAVLWLRALIAGVNGLVFTYDPITSTGILTNTADQPNGVLDLLRDGVTLEDLSGPVAGVQSLAGTNVLVSDDDVPTIPPPTEATGTDFDYPSRTDNFAAVNAYYHANNFFAVIEDLGFDRDTYFDGTSFPVHVDHRASANDPGGIEINAFCMGDAQGDGIGLVGYCLANLIDTTNPLGRAVDKYVHWHEIGGHGILWDHVDSPNFGFSHSAGDGLAGLQSDPESLLRELGLVERFRYTPFRPIRWMNRDVASGWGWGGANDTGGYPSEEILATTHFRIYRSIGGDSDDLDRRRLASRVVSYLILRAVGDLTPITNPGTAEAWWTRLMATDAFDWTTEGLSGGAYRKVIRWAFEVQGLFRPSGAPATDPGAPPPVDVYIDDGRVGTYAPYLAEFANTADVWNRHFPDGGTAHEEPLAGFPSFVYVRVRNRGTEAAADPSVKLFQADPASGLDWPSTWTPAATAQLAASGPIPSGGETVVGPFSWSLPAAGPVSLLASASATGDASNADTVSGPIANWRLVPFDNNLAQRDVTAETADPCEQIGQLADYISTLNLNQGLEQSLRAKLRNAKRDCERGHTTPACNKLGAFDNEVKAQTDKGITAAQAVVLRGHSDGIKAVLGC